MKIEHKLNIKKDLHFFIFSQLNDLRHWDITLSDVKILSELYNKDFEIAFVNRIENFKNRMTILFSKEVKDEIMHSLNMSYNTFNNSLSKLRKKGLIDKDNSLNEKLLFNINKDSFTFTIEFKDGE